MKHLILIMQSINITLIWLTNWILDNVFHFRKVLRKVKNVLFESCFIKYANDISTTSDHTCTSADINCAVPDNTCKESWQRYSSYTILIYRQGHSYLLNYAMYLTMLIICITCLTLWLHNNWWIGQPVSIKIKLHHFKLFVFCKQKSKATSV